jgi:hypothetical protein
MPSWFLHLIDHFLDQVRGSGMNFPAPSPRCTDLRVRRITSRADRPPSHECVSTTTRYTYPWVLIQHTLSLNNFRLDRIYLHDNLPPVALHVSFIYPPLSRMLSPPRASRHCPYVHFTPMCGEIRCSQCILRRWLVRRRSGRLTFASPVNRWTDFIRASIPCVGHVQSGIFP